jgi:uncharacterized protein with HEPN domain
VPPTLADRLRYVLDSIEALERLLKGKTLQDYDADPVLQAATERFLERICEASRHIPAGVRTADIPWRRMIDFGNLLRHSYHSIDAKTVWEITVADVPALRAFAERIIRDESQ